MSSDLADSTENRSLRDSHTQNIGQLAWAQYGAVLRMRWQLLRNSLRTKQGKFELGARIFSTGFFAVLGLGVGTGCGVAAYKIFVDGQLLLLPALLWPIFLAWQVVPVLLSTAQESVEFNFLLRFPVSFRSYTLLYLLFGIFDPASLLGGICLTGVWIGAVVARPGLVLWITAALTLFALFNFMLTRTIFAWIERWLAQRKTREVLGIVMLCFFLSFQLLNPALHRHSVANALSGAALAHAAAIVTAVQVFFPPGMAGDAVAMAGNRSYFAGAGLLGAMALYAGSVGALLSLRLRAEFRGENFGEAPAASAKAVKMVRADPRGVATSTMGIERRGWLSGPIGAVLVKEVRILSRSGVMLFGLITPLVLIFVMGGPVRAGQGFSFPYIFPVAVAYGFLPLTRQFCNSLGTEGAGIQLYFLSPTPFRSVMLAKNLLQTGLFCVEVALAATMAVYRFGAPSPGLAFATLCWLLFALPANLAAGNILSITLAYRMTLTRLSREQGSVGNGLMSLVIQLLIFAVGVAVYVPLALRHRSELAGPIFLALASGSVMLWLRGLANVDAMANRRREALISTLARPA